MGDADDDNDDPISHAQPYQPLLSPAQPCIATEPQPHSQVGRHQHQRTNSSSGAVAAAAAAAAPATQTTGSERSI